MSTETMNINETDLTRLASEIRAAHEAAVSAVDRADALEHARNAGQLLLEAKELVAHGGWLPWAEVNCPAIGARQVQKYMKLAANWHAIAPKLTPDAQLSIEGALRLLAEEPGDDSETHPAPDDSDSLDAPREGPFPEPNTSPDSDSAPASDVRAVPVTAPVPPAAAGTRPPALPRPTPPTPSTPRPPARALPRPTTAPAPKPVAKPPSPPTLWQHLDRVAALVPAVDGTRPLDPAARAARIRALEATARALMAAAHRLRHKT